MSVSEIGSAILSVLYTCCYDARGAELTLKYKSALRKLQRVLTLEWAWQNLLILPMSPAQNVGMISLLMSFTLLTKRIVLHSCVQDPSCQTGSLYGIKPRLPLTGKYRR